MSTLSEIAEAIAGLPERERLVMSLYYKEELNLRETGEVPLPKQPDLYRVRSAGVVLPRGVVGKTPYLHAAFAGNYEVTVQLAGYQSARVGVKVEPDKKETVQVLLNLGEGEAKPSGRKLPLWRTITGWSAVGTGGLVLTVGVIGMIDDPRDGKAIAGLVVGSALAAGGILLLTLPYPRPAKK